MSVYCSQCGEKLMGSVNVCWHCEKSIQGPTDELPPIRTTAVKAVDSKSGAPRSQSSWQQHPSDRPFYPKRVFRENCAIISVFVGVMTCLMVPHSWSLALIPATVGLILGVLGLSSSHRITATVGLLLGLAVFAGSAIQGVVSSYQ